MSTEAHATSRAKLLAQLMYSHCSATVILVSTLVGRFADDTTSLMTPQTSLSDVLVSRHRRACYNSS